MSSTPPWKPVLIVVVLAAAFASMLPFERKLRPGRDLAGGTTLVYEVNLPEDADPDREIEAVIDVLKRRVDPDGVRNLLWRRQGGNRIEIQMALAPAETVRLRETYTKARDALEAFNFSERDLSAALRLEDTAQRLDALKRLAGDSEPRLALLRQAGADFDALEKARVERDAVEKTIDEAAKALAKVPADAPDELRAKAEELLKRARRDGAPKLKAFNDAKALFEAQQRAALQTNVNWAEEVEPLLFLPTEYTDKDGNATNPRQEAIDKLTVRHPEAKALIDQVAAAWSAYDAVRGQLDDPNDLKALLRGSGVLEFRIAPSPAAVVDLDRYREDLRTKGPRTATSPDYRWFEVDEIESFAETEAAQQQLKADPEAYFATYSGRGLVGQEYAGKYYILLSNRPDQSMTQADQGWKLEGARQTTDSNMLLAVGFSLNAVGGQMMGQLTGAHVGEPMAIVLDGRVVSTPNLQSRITSQGIITGGSGGFSQEELDYLVRTLKAGSLKAQLSEEPVSEITTGPQLGQDNLRRGLSASVWSLVIVAAFIACYYFFAGLVADFALAANMVLILGAMAFLGANFTLPGIAGIVLTIGMAVDANVLIFERIREELERDADLKTAVRLGYEKALSTILDANITTLITCLVLGYTATAEVKGFAVTLGIGICATLFTALFCTRVIIDLFMDIRKPKTLAMLPTSVEAIRKLLHPKVDWLSLRKFFFPVSAVMIVVGIGMVSLRGADMLDIEFRSGTQVGFELAEGKTLSLKEARDRLDKAAEEAGIKYLAADQASVVTQGTITGGAEMRAGAFSIATLETESRKVSDAVKSAFGDVLDVQLPLSFRDMGEGVDAPPLTEAPVYRVTQRQLGGNINRPGVTDDVSEYLGGVAVVLDDIEPASSVEDVQQRISRMRMQPLYEGLTPRTFTVIGLDLAADAGEGGTALYRSAVVLSRDKGTNYVEDPSGFDEGGGLADTEWRLIRDGLRRETSLASVSNFSSQVSGTMARQAIVAIMLSLFFVVLYIWLRFGSLRYGFAAIVALVHDVTISLGLVALTGYLAGGAIGNLLGLDPFRVDLAMVAAVLTIIGYSLNDTIVVFDRIRENRGRLAFATPAIINDSINQTISRTMLTSGTTMLALLILYMLGGPGVHGFAFAMLVGVMVGTYSSIAIASPVLLIGTGKEGAGGGGSGVPADHTDQKHGRVAPMGGVSADKVAV